MTTKQYILKPDDKKHFMLDIETVNDAEYQCNVIFDKLKGV